jgi:hypothetical protein
MTEPSSFPGPDQFFPNRNPKQQQDDSYNDGHSAKLHPLNPARPSLRTSQGPKPKLACFMNAMLKAKHANPISNFAQRLNGLANDDDFDLIFNFNLQGPQAK